MGERSTVAALNATNTGPISGHGEDLNHLIWDIKNAKEVFESLKPVGLDQDHLSRFVITDGGLTLFKPHT